MACSQTNSLASHSDQRCATTTHRPAIHAAAWALTATTLEPPLRPGSATPVTDSVVRVSRSRLAKCAGGQPTFRVNATLNALAEL